MFDLVCCCIPILIFENLIEVSIYFLFSFKSTVTTKESAKSVKVIFKNLNYSYMNLPLNHIVFCLIFKVN